MSDMKCYRIAIVFLTACVGASADLAAQQPADAEVVKQVLDAWQKRRQAMKSVFYRVEGTEIYAKGSMTEDHPIAHPRVRKEFPSEDLSLPAKKEYTFEFQSGKVRKERRIQVLNAPLGEFAPYVEISFFDGKKVTVYHPRDDNTSDVYTPSVMQPELILHKGGTTHLLEQDAYPVLLAHGYPILYNQSADVAGFFDRPIESSRFYYHERGVIEDRRCVIVRTVPEAGKLGIFDEFWVDLKRDGAVLRWQASKRGVPYIRYDIRYRQVDGNWLPASWEFDLFPTRNGRPEFRRGERLKVIDVQVNPTISATTFVAPKKHGMVVTDTTALGVYVIGSDDRTLVPFGQSTSVWRWWHFMGAVVLSGTLLALVIWWFRRRPGIKP
jgi:hypothetical protein